MPLLEIKDLQIEFGTGRNAARAVDGVSLTLRALAGNRADDGKTTSLEWEG